MSGGTAELERMRYPVGRLERAAAPTPAQRARWLQELEGLPAALRAAVAGLDESQLDTPYRDGGWTVRQLVHHVADSHVNGYIRFSLAVAEEGRTAVTYDQDAWADQAFARTGPLEPSLALLEGLHARWVATARGLGAQQLAGSIEHPEAGRMTVEDVLNLYAWHSRHHVAHIRALRERQGW